MNEFFDVGEFNDALIGYDLRNGPTGAAVRNIQRWQPKIPEIIADIDGLDTIFIDIVEEFLATAEDLHSAWIYFRMTNIACLSKYGPPLDNEGAPLNDIPAINIDVQITSEWFKKFIELPICKILRIETGLGGMIIRKSSKTDHCLHKFTCADLPAEPGRKIATASFEAIMLK